MKKKVWKSIIFGVIFIVGLIILMRSINLGDLEISNIMKAHGGGMETNAYLVYLQQSIIKYRFLGSILSVLGGFGVLLNTVTKS